MIILLYGDNRLAIDERQRALREQYDSEGFATSIFEYPAAGLDAIRAACSSPGFFGTPRVVIVSGLLAPVTRRPARPASTPPTALQDTLASIPDSTVLVLVEYTSDHAIAHAAQRLAPGIVVEHHATPRGDDLVAWTRDRAVAHGCTLDRACAVALLEALFPASWQRAARYDDLAPDLYRLDQELAKLALAAHPDGTVTEALVRDLVTGEVAGDDWALGDALAAGDPAAAARELEGALARGVQPEVVLGQLVSQFEVYAALSRGGRSSIAELARETGISEGRLRRSQAIVARLDQRRVAEAIDALRALDASAKGGHVDLASGLVAVVQRLASLATRENGAARPFRRTAQNRRP